MPLFWKAKIAGSAICAALLIATSAAEAVPVNILAMKVSDSSPGGLDPYLGWVNNGGFNEGNPLAQLLTNNGLDYKNSLIDTSWASVLGVRVSMYSQGVEQAFVQFNPGTTKTDFFTQANVTASTWADVAGPGNFFSIAGHAGINRHWFINNNYGGCGADVGHMVVIDGSSGVCGWENSRTPPGIPTRGFLYSTSNVEQNWTNGSIGVADVFAVHVTVDQPNGQIPEPGTLALFGLGLAGLGFARRRKAA